MSRPSSIFALALILALSFSQSACSTFFGMEQVAGARDPLPSARTVNERIPEKEEYLYSGCRFYADTTILFMYYVSIQTAFVASPAVIVYGIVDGTLTVVTDTILAPFTYLADESRRGDFEALPIEDYPAAQPVRIAPVKEEFESEPDPSLNDNK